MNPVLIERGEQLLTLRDACWKRSIGRDVSEQERQIEHLELVVRLVELRERRRDHLDVAERERLERFAILHELRRGYTST